MRRTMIMKWMLVVAALTSGLSARVGETEPELIKRFGQPRSRSKHVVSAQGRIWDLGPTLFFKDADWTIISDLVDGRCARIRYSKVGEWTEEHFATVLNANAQGETWTAKSDGRNKKLLREWKRSDGATAQWIATTGLQIVVPAYVRAKSVAEAKAKAAAAAAPRKI